MTTNYARGANFERRVRDLYYQRGASLVVRAAGSHTPVDLVALYPNGDVDLIQCKRDGKLPAAEVEKAYDLEAVKFHTLTLAYLDDKNKIATRKVNP